MRGLTVAAFEWPRGETVEEHLHPAAPFGGALDEGHGPEVPWIRLIVGEHEPPEAVAGETANDLPPTRRSVPVESDTVPLQSSASGLAP